MKEKNKFEIAPKWLKVIKMSFITWLCRSLEKVHYVAQKTYDKCLAFLN